MKRLSSISLTRKGKKFVDAQLASGRYESANQIVEKSLDLLDHTERLYQSHIDTVRAGVRRGIADADAGRFVPIEKITIESIRAMAKFRAKPRRSRKSA